MVLTSTTMGFDSEMLLVRLEVAPMQCERKSGVAMMNDCADRDETLGDGGWSVLDDVYEV